MLKRNQSLGLNRHPSTAPKPPAFLVKIPLFDRLSAWSAANLNFYRLHLLAFIITPLVFSAIFYASNGVHHIEYVDCLFMVVSAMTVTGLNSVLLADCTLWQQVILFLMMCLGSTSSVSILTIIIRRQFFKRKFEYMVTHSADARSRVNKLSTSSSHRFPSVFTESVDDVTSTPPTTNHHSRNSSSTMIKEKKGKKPKLRADMVRRVDVPVRVNQMNVGGWLREVEENNSGVGNGVGGRGGAAIGEHGDNENALDDDEEGLEIGNGHQGRLVEEPDELASKDTRSPSVDRGERLDDREKEVVREVTRGIQIDDSTKPDRGLSLRRGLDPNGFAPPEHDGQLSQIPENPTFHLPPPELSPSQPNTPTVKYFPRSRTIEFRNDEDHDLRLRRNRTHHATVGYDGDHHPTRRLSHSSLRGDSTTLTRGGLQRTPTHHPEDALHSGFGGFPNPLVAAADFARRKLPGLNQVERHLTMPRTTTLASIHTNTDAGGNGGPKKGVSYITFDAVVGRNSTFKGLTTAQQEELGGVEYRALTALLKIVAGYWFFSQMICVLMLAPWLSGSKKYRLVFEDPEYHVNPTWFVFFQVWSAFSNNGMSLVDASMVPFRDAYLLIVLMGFLILGGNTAFPVFLRFVIWVISKIVPSRSRTRETLQFLLDHPRRCFIYLFPSHQTWFLVFVLVVLNSVDWVSFLVLDIGNPEIEQIPVGTRVIDGLLQAFAVRSAGFATVSLANVAPAVQVLYAIMMYIAVYPIAVSIRSTNVYEEKSMGVFAAEDDESEVEAQFEKEKGLSPTSYIAYHARKQLAFDMWWLVLALWLICIIERHNIIDDSSPWITIFSVLFEICSSYGTVGLSLGTPTKNTSLAGTLRTLSKLVLCAVMIRGRHRGLPIAIDRAVLLPSDLAKHGDDTMGTYSGDYGGLSSRRGSGERPNHGLSTVPAQTDAERVRGASDKEEDVYLHKI